VVGFAALGAILFARIGGSVADALPNLAGTDRLAITHAIANGNLASATALLQAHDGATSIARSSLGYGYEGVLLAAGIIALSAAALCWWLVSAEETAPHEAAAAQVMELSVD
jgi:hypothetical protein